MAKGGLKYVASFVTKGVRRYYFRRGSVCVRLHGEPGSVEFITKYAEVLAATAPGQKRNPHDRGSLNWLLTEYRASAGFQRLAPKTRESYNRMLNYLQPIGRFRVADIERRHIQAIRREQFAGRPRTSDEFAKVASIVFGFAVDQGVIDRNPAEKLKHDNKSEPYRAWTSEECARFEAACPPGPILTAFMLGLHTGQRRDDVLRMSWAAYDGTHIEVCQGKTRTRLKVRAHTRLRAYLETLPRDSLLMVPSRTGGKWDGSGFSKAFRATLRLAGLNGLVFHGLRHTAASRLAEAGCTSHEIASITGHKSLGMVGHYTAGANQERLGDAAIARLEGRDAKK